jgi:rhamnosyltransferase
MGRIFHYFNKLKLAVQKRGLASALYEGAQFLIRRWFGLQFLAEAIEYHCLAAGRSIPGTLMSRIEFKPLKATRALIYVGFDPQSLILDHVVTQLRFFSDQGYDIIFVTTAPQVLESEIKKIQPYCAQILHRKNIGYDFASYALGFEALKPSVQTLDSLVVMNDSCTGPHFDFVPLLNQMIQASEAVYGLTKSLEISEHIQSYFYHFGAKVNASGATTKFFDRIRILNSKWGIVRYLEIGSSTSLSRMGISLKALIDPEDPKVLDSMRKFGLTEPTREPLAAILKDQNKLPFIKRSSQGRL